MPATSPAAIAPATSTAPIETHQRIAALPSFHGDGDTQDAPRKAGTCVAVHIRVSRSPLGNSRKAAYLGASGHHRRAKAALTAFTTDYQLISNPPDNADRRPAQSIDHCCTPK